VVPFESNFDLSCTVETKPGGNGGKDATNFANLRVINLAAAGATVSSVVFDIDSEAAVTNQTPVTPGGNPTVPANGGRITFGQRTDTAGVGAFCASATASGHGPNGEPFNLGPIDCGCVGN